MFLFKGLWDSLTSEGNAKIAEIQKNIQNEITILKQDRQKYPQPNHQNEQEKLVLEQIIINYKTKNSGLKAKLEGVIQQLQEKQDLIEELKHQNRQIQANLEYYRTESTAQRQVQQQRFEQQQSVLEKTLQGLQQDLRQSQQTQTQLKQAKE